MNQAPNHPVDRSPTVKLKQEASQKGLTPDFTSRALELGLTTPDKNGNLVEFSSITTDSRKIQQGCLFVALPGEKFDGHDFILNAITQGARGILCRKDFSFPAEARANPDLWIFGVEDTVEAYRKLGAAWRQCFDIPVIGVAGSVGKTTTKEILTAILRGKWPQTLKTQGSQNGFVGIPMTLLEIKPEHQAAVIEIGIDEPGAMIQHMNVVRPNCSIVTAIGPEHLEKLIDIQTVAREEVIALDWVAGSAQKNKFVAVNLDDPWILPAWEQLSKGRRLGYTFDVCLAQKLSNGAEIWLGSMKGSQLEVSCPAFSGEKFELPLPGQHNAQNLLGAITLAAGLGLTPAEIRAGLMTFKGAEGRSEIRQLPDSTQVICDYYNAQPASMAAGLELLAQLARSGHGTLWACLGDMLEMGTEEERLHRELADRIISCRIKNILLYGPRMRFLEDELKKRKVQGHVQHFATHAELAQSLIRDMKPGDAILIKGSRGMKMEEVWKLLEASK